MQGHTRTVANSQPTQVILGVHVVAGGLWFGPVDSDKAILVDSERNMKVDYDMLGEGRALSELEEGVEALLRRLAPSVVAFLDAGTSSQARSTGVAHRRGHVEAAVLIAAARVGVPVERVTHATAKGVFGAAPTKPEFRAAVAAAVGQTDMSNWNHRSPALGAALVVADSVNNDE